MSRFDRDVVIPLNTLSVQLWTVLGRGRVGMKNVSTDRGTFTCLVTKPPVEVGGHRD